MATGFPAKTSFTDGQALPASDLNDLAGTLNKIYSTSGYPQQLSYVSATDSVLRPIPFATSTDKVTYASNISAGAGVAVSMTFGSSVRFTVAPIVTVSAELTPTTAYASTSVHSVSTSGFSVRIFNVGSTTITNTYFHYHAIQMTATRADNN
jgi:hypothetical protein